MDDGRGGGEGASPGGAAPPARQVGWVLRLLAGSRYLIAVAVVGLVISAATLILYATAAVVVTVVRTATSGAVGTDGAKRLTVDFIELADAFLLGAVLVIVGLGLYELFIEPDLPVPPWLRVRNLDELKAKFVGVIVVLFGVTFLPYIVDWDGQATILHAGLAVAAVIAAFALQTLVSARVDGSDGRSNKE